MKTNPNKCVFCGRKNKKSGGYPDYWRTKIKLVFISDGKLLKEASVCPECRENYKIMDLYEQESLV